MLADPNWGGQGWTPYGHQHHQASILPARRPVGHCSEVAERPQLSLWDALLMTAAVQGHAAKLVTEDLPPGQTIEGVRIENPFAALSFSEQPAGSSSQNPQDAPHSACFSTSWHRCMRRIIKMVENFPRVRGNGIVS